MFLSAYLVLCLAEIPPSRPDVGIAPAAAFTLNPAPQGQTFQWGDGDEVLRGTLNPNPAREGEPVTIIFSVEPVSGPPVDLPVTVGLRPEAQQGGTETHTVRRNPGQPTWSVTLTPPRDGPHALEFSWLSTHRKTARGVLQVEGGLVPAWFKWALATLLVLGSTGGAALALWRARNAGAQGFAAVQAENGERKGEDA